MPSENRHIVKPACFHRSFHDELNSCPVGKADYQVLLLSYCFPMLENLPALDLRFGNTALHIAAKRGNAKAVYELLKAHIDMDAENAEKKTAQTLAFESGHDNIVHMFNETGTGRIPILGTLRWVPRLCACAHHRVETRTHTQTQTQAHSLAHAHTTPAGTLRSPLCAACWPRRVKSKWKIPSPAHPVG